MKLLNIYVTAGYPELESLPEVIEKLNQEDVDMIEVGIPYSDPLADGPTIQKSSMKAIENGMTLDLLFEQLQSVSSKAELILMGYFNSILLFGVEEFCKRAEACGVSGVIIPDLPIELYQRDYKSLFETYDIKIAQLVTPNTDTQRLEKIIENSSLFVYAVSSASTTGTKNFEENTAEYLKAVKERAGEKRVLTGFNVKDRESFNKASEYTDGAIIGSAFINALNPDDLAGSISGFIKQIR